MNESLAADGRTSTTDVYAQFAPFASATNATEITSPMTIPTAVGSQLGARGPDVTPARADRRENVRLRRPAEIRRLPRTPALRRSSRPAARRLRDTPRPPRSLGGRGRR